MNLLNNMKIAGNDNSGNNEMYSLYMDLEKTQDDARSALEVTTEKP